MKTIYKMLLVNGSCLLGIILVAVVSPDVSVLAFGISSLMALALVNGAVFFLPWLRRRRGQPVPAPRSASETNFGVAFGLLFFLSICC